MFIDWPYTSSTQTDILTRSTDGGNSFRLLVDPQCPQRNRPNCATGGGGDSEDEVNLQTGTVLFADQQGVAAEAVSSSTDGGDSFPVGRQFAVTAPVTGVDRQWLASAGKAIFKSATGSPIEALYSYHIPAVGEYIVGIDDTGKPVPQPAPQLTGVSQSGQMRIDTGSGPARGWVYVPFITSAGYQVGTVEGKNYADPTKWKVSGVSSDGPDIFPWIALDKVGNAYAVWSSGGVAWYSFSAIADPANNPAAGGRPATHWSTKVAVSLPTMRSAVFPEVTAGDDGRVAITYDATSAPGADDKPYAPDLAPETAPWDAYVVILTNATATGGSPIAATFSTVSHRHVHIGTVCTSGTTCTGDRSLLDLTDVGYDSDGRVSVIYTDNNSGFQLSSSTVDNDPFVLFAKQVSGPSLLTTSPRVKVFVPKGHTTDATGDAKGVNVAAGISLPSLDLGAASLSEGRNPATGRDEVTATFTLADASAARMTSDLAAYNTANPLLAPAQRLQYIARFSTSTDIYHLSFEQLADGTRRAFAGKLDANDGLFVANATAIAGAAYHTDAAMPVTFRVDGTTVTLVIDAAAIGIPDGTPIYSATIFATAGPTEANEKTVVNSMRTVDATPAFDGRL